MPFAVARSGNSQSTEAYEAKQTANISSTLTITNSRDRLMKEIAINQASRMEIEYDINNGLFSATYEANNKCYYDAENELDIEVHSEYKHLIGAWQFDVTVTDRNGDEYMLEEGQWEKLYKALMVDIEEREKEERSEMEHIKHLWRTAYA